MPNLVLEHEKIVDFFETLYPQQKWDGIITIQALKKSGETGKSRTTDYDWFIKESIREINWERWAAWQEAGNSLYFSPSFQEHGTKAPRKGSTKGSSVLFADIDNVAMTDLPRLMEECPIKPNLANWTGNGFHFFWILTESCLDISPNGKLEVALRKVHTWVGGDHTYNINRLLRVPYTYNVKPERFGLDGFPICHTVHKDLGMVCHIDAFLRIKLNRKEINLEPEFIQRFIIDGEFIGGPDDPERRSRRDFVVAKELFLAGHDREEIEWLFQNSEWGISGKVLEKATAGGSFDYLKETLDKAYKASLTSKNAAIRDDGEYIFKTFYGKNGVKEETCLSNFCINPVARISVDDINNPLSPEMIKVEMRFNEGRKLREVTVATSAFSTSNTFILACGIPLLSFSGNNTDWQLYTNYLSNKEIPTQQATKSLGWTDKTFVVPSGSITGPVLDYADSGLNYSCITTSDTTPVELTPQFCRDLLKHCSMGHKPSEGLFALGWMLASVFAPQVRARYTGQFPMLLINGGPGAGKTTLVRELMSCLYGIEAEYSGQTTAAVFKRVLSYINALPVFVDELETTESRSSITMVSYLRLLWQQGYTQMMGDLDLKGKVFNIQLNAPCVVTNIIGLQDEAAVSRGINIRLTPFNREEGYASREWLHSLPQGGFLKSWLEKEPTWVEKMHKYKSAVQSDNERQQHCFATAIAPLLFIAGEQYADEGRINITYLQHLWEEQTNRQEEISALHSLDIGLAYLVRNTRMLPNTEYIRGYVFDSARKVTIHRAHFVDLMCISALELRLSHEISRAWVLKTLKDAEHTREVLRYNFITTRNSHTGIYFTIDLEKWPLTHEAMSGHFNPEEMSRAIQIMKAKVKKQEVEENEESVENFEKTREREATLPEEATQQGEFDFGDEASI